LGRRGAIVTPIVFQTPLAQRRTARRVIGLALLGIDLLAAATYHFEDARAGLIGLLLVAPLHLLWLLHLRQLAPRLCIADGELRYEAPGKRLIVALDALRAVHLEPRLAVSTDQGLHPLPLATFSLETAAALALRALRPTLEHRVDRWRRAGLPLILHRRPGYTAKHLGICLLLGLFGVGLGLGGGVDAWDQAWAGAVGGALGSLALGLGFGGVLLALCALALRSYVLRWEFGPAEIGVQGLFRAVRWPVGALQAVERSEELRSYRGQTWPCALLTLRFAAPYAPLVVEPTENGLSAALEPRADAALLDDLAEALVALYGLPAVARTEKSEP
jgi:hypothetical protein